MKMDYIEKTYTPETLRPFYLPDKVLGYCAHCKDYGHFWGCPPHELNGMTVLNAFKTVALVGLKVTLSNETESFGTVFQSARRDLGSYLENLAAESNTEHHQVLIAGNCYGCESCSRKDQLPCKNPKALRFSLESLGFEVSGISEQLLDLPIQWPRAGEMPEYLVCVGAVLLG